ncbi:MAG TPA: RDD family protein [Pyrinomonadaceae bacterium]|nr:RDD family protein [Pyrinomonadaceae bacterium]
MTAAQDVSQANARSRTPRTEGNRLRAPFALRCGALLVDYVTVMSIIVLGTLVARMLGGGARSAGTSAETIGVLAAAVAAVLNLGVIPGLTGRTLGKWATGLRIERINGEPMGIGRALVRHFVGYPVSFLILGLGFLISALTERGRGLHDMIAGTIVVREGSLPSPRR